MTRFRVEFRQEWVVESGTLIEAFDAEWQEAQQRGLDENAFARETLHILGDDQIGDFAAESLDDWEVSVA